MRIVVDASSLGPGDERLRRAAAALARRGHVVEWHGERSADGTAGGPHTAPGRIRAEVVVGSSRRPLATAWLGWRARAHCMVLGLRAEAVRGWGPFARWACDSLYTAGLVEPREQAEAPALPHGIPLDRLALWSADPPPEETDPDHLDTELLERACERALARHRGRAPRPAVFLDRDGTLVVERGYLSDPADLELLPGAAEALRNLRAAGYPVVVISNQSGVGRGLFPAARVHQAMAKLREALRDRGVELDAIYFCPHRPEAGCPCRKPGTALIERAAEDLLLAPARSAMVGDKLLDVATGHRAGAFGILVRSGYGRDEEQRIAGGELERPPDAVCDDLAGAARWILARGEAAED